MQAAWRDTEHSCMLRIPICAVDMQNRLCVSLQVHKASLGTRLVVQEGVSAEVVCIVRALGRLAIQVRHFSCCCVAIRKLHGVGVCTGPEAD